MLTKDNISYLAAYTQYTEDPGFRLLFENWKEINSIMGNPAFIQPLLHYIIYVNDLEPTVLSSQKAGIKELKWVDLEDRLSKVYNAYFAKRVVDETKIRWYRSQNNHAQRAKSIVNYVNAFISDLTVDELNLYAWDVFNLSNEKTELTQARNWAKFVVKVVPDSDLQKVNYIDTYANILYKLKEK